jgi:hypothetical protein
MLARPNAAGASESGSRPRKLLAHPKAARAAGLPDARAAFDSACSARPRTSRPHEQHERHERHGHTSYMSYTSG